MYRATGPGQVEVISEDRIAGRLEALLYNFDFDDFAGRTFRPLKPEHANFLSARVLPLVENGRGNVWLQGSASQIGATGWNMTTSMVRAGQIQAYLLDRDVKQDQIEANAIGETQAATHAKDDSRDRAVYLWVHPRSNQQPVPKKVPPKPKPARKLQKLYIYDRSSGIDRWQAAGRFGAGEVLQIGIDKGIAELKSTFDSLALQNYVFNRALFQTHGGPGRIWFGNDALNKETLKSMFSGYTSLFPRAARIYFDGCNVAEGGAGTDFLIVAGSVFLTNGGGDVLGWVNFGLGMPFFVPFIRGHTIHFGGGNNLKRIRFYRGGAPNFPDSSIPAR